jgi:hypothetical protein
MPEYNSTIAAMMSGMPDRVRRLPISENGYPTPWFAATVPLTGKRDLRIADSAKRALAVKRSLCWVCGGKLGTYKAFVIGPMCVVNRTTSEPACHLECALFSVAACPFLTKPRMRRNDVDLPPEIEEAPGFGIMRNPGATCIWVCKKFKVFRVSAKTGEWLIQIGDAVNVEWWAEGKHASREQVEQSINSGLPILLDMARQDGPDAMEEVGRRHQEAVRLLPAA